MINYRNGIRSALWIGGVFAVLGGLSLCLWGVLLLAGDRDGAVVARVLSIVCGIVTALTVTGLVVLLAKLQLDLLETEEPAD